MKTKDEAQVPKKFYDEIDALKGIAIFLVVLGHSIILYPIDLHENVVWQFVFQWLSGVHMPLFFLISGFCFSYVGGYKAYIWKKTKRILIPYVAFGILDMLPRSLFPAFVNRPSDFAESLRKIVFSGGEFWFLYTLFFIFLLFPLIYKLLSKNIGCAICVLGAVLLLNYIIPSISLFTINSIKYYLFYFTLGAIIKVYIGGRVFDIKLSKAVAAVSATSLLVIWFLLLKFDVPHMAIVKALIGILFFYICMQSGMIVKAFKRFGKYSLQIYLLNGFLLVISRTIIVSLMAATEPFIIVAFNMLVDFVLSYIGIKYVCTKIKPIRFIMGMLP